MGSRIVLISTSMGLALATVVLAEETPTADTLLRQLEQLKQRVAELEQRQTTLAAGDVNQVVERVLRDADSRSRLFSESGAITAGFDKGRFFIRSADGNYLLMPSFLFQTRYTANWRNDGGGSDDDDTETGFEIRRMRPIFEGHAITPNLQYKFQWESRNTDGGLFLQDAWVRYKFADQWKVEIGQFKDAIHHEEAMADQFVLTADRSFINALIGGGNIDRIQGVMLMYDDAEHLRVNLVAHDGYNTKNTDFTDTGGGSTFVGVNDLDYGFSARMEYTIAGTAKQYDDFTARGNTQDLAVAGAGVNWSQGGDSSVLFHTVDFQWENSAGLGVYGALMGMCREIGADAPIAEGNYYDWGGLVQAGYMVSDKCEIFGRYEYIDVDQDALAAGAESTLHEVTIGTNYYWHGHNAKFTVDLSYLPNGSPIGVPLLGILAGTDDQIVLRLQAQLLL